MSGDARKRMRRREVDVFNYYDDMGPGKGNCTWGAGILAHRGPCTPEELGKSVSQAEVDAEFSRKVAHAERIVRINVTTQRLNQAQFDALVSLTYNAGERGASGTFDLVDSGDFKGAADNISKMIKTTVKGKKVVARGLISRRKEEAAPFREAAEAQAQTARK
ncbi:glycoside hydrolase family protein [Massilia sp. GER05]|uniref:glycoside hydrolase family protein n=1 Tax=Massilia sp. GER05 TaxID=3394605 RepID=UPI003F8291C9